MMFLTEVRPVAGSRILEGVVVGWLEGGGRRRRDVVSAEAEMECASQESRREIS